MPLSEPISRSHSKPRNHVRESNAVRDSAYQSRRVINNNSSASNNKNEGYADNSVHEQRRQTKRDGTRVIRDHLIAASGEGVCTILFLFFAFAWHKTVVIHGGNESTPETVMYISVGYGFSLLVCAWSFYRVSGGLCNPAVCLGMILTRKLPLVRGIILMPVEIVGGIVAAYLVKCMFPGDIGVVNTTLSDDTSVVQGVFIEMFLTSLLLITILMLAAEKTKVTFMAPLGIGLALFVAELAGVYYTGGSLNPARSFGPAVASGMFVHYHWIYWVGPCLGSLLAAGYFHLIKFFDYEAANDGQDSAGGDFTGIHGDGGRV